MNTTRRANPGACARRRSTKSVTLVFGHCGNPRVRYTQATGGHEAARKKLEATRAETRGWVQRTGIPQATLSAIENDRVRLGVERAKVLAKALKCHPAVLVFPGWEDDVESAA